MHLKFENLSIGYESALTNQPINIQFNAPQLCMIFGNNGCGKTTLIKTIARLLQPLNGKILIDHKNIFEIKSNSFAHLFSFLFTTRPFLMNHTVWDILTLGRIPYLNWTANLTTNDRDIIYYYAEQLNIVNILDKDAHQISDGQFQKVLIAKTLIQQTPIIILDEPLSYIDFNTKKIILKTLQKIAHTENKLILMSSHDIHLCKKDADNILLLHQKEWLYSDSQTIQSNKLFSDFFN